MSRDLAKLYNGSIDHDRNRSQRKAREHYDLLIVSGCIRERKYCFHTSQLDTPKTQTSL